MYRWVDHPSEVELEIEASSPAGVLADALHAFAELVGDSGPAGEPLAVRVTVHAADWPGLLAAWLEELVYLADAEALVPERASDLTVSEGEASATVHGHRGAARPLVKAVTYHRLELAPAHGGWRARAVRDV